MTWAGQVRTVFIKDLRQTWWMTTVLVVLIATFVLGTIAPPPTASRISAVLGALIPLIMLQVLTAILRTDPPALSTAFWATQPLQPTAMATE
jgi:hypothetical protein